MTDRPDISKANLPWTLKKGRLSLLETGDYDDPVEIRDSAGKLVAASYRPDDDEDQFRLIVAAVNAYHPTPPAVGVSDLERASAVRAKIIATMTGGPWGAEAEQIIAAEFAAIRREAAASPTRNDVIEECVRVALSYRGEVDAGEHSDLSDPAHTLGQGYAANLIAKRLRVLKYAPSPTPLVKELAEALKTLTSEAAAWADFEEQVGDNTNYAFLLRRIEEACAVLARAKDVGAI